MSKLYRIIIDVQGGELLDTCNKLYDGKGYGTVHSDYNGKAVIKYLKEWDGYEHSMDDLTEEEPRWVNNGTDYVHTLGKYTLIVNNTLGGVYMLYRNATRQERKEYAEQ